MRHVEGALIIVVVVVTLGCALAIYTLVGRGKAHRQNGSDRISTDEPDAGNAARRRRDAARLDVERELAALSGQRVEEGLRDEVRRLVLARNRRREREGEAPLDVEAEVDRQLRELT